MSADNIHQIPTLKNFDAIVERLEAKTAADISAARRRALTKALDALGTEKEAIQLQVLWTYLTRSFELDGLNTVKAAINLRRDWREYDRSNGSR
jgi:hypothetical protein